ncbi:Carbon monoxide dehydrogenase subunit G (CoxG) [Pigmentiphaga humi]|uniref:Carbon monoxide dehydrogenase subunit G (CoxG) n=1 Tax=Pigmentiphaga humi TaxID=2478468 RepID=A0A3P4AXS9_9BURK|nr:SRPBCC family protein [Pigmentiphaga humi]VCU68884.1 Carbon monoxide dehydrogenase subunit G (CoxG) [Pigmentiphaga humi]
MEIEKVLTAAAPVAKVWEMLLDPTVMGSCVPGMKSIEVVSDTEYNAVIHVKISFISAKFRLKTRIVEQRAPDYLRVEGTGEDASVASSLKQQSEIFLTGLPDGRTELRTKVTVDVLGRLGTFGLSIMKTKADRMWDEFSQNLATRLNGGEVPGAAGIVITQEGEAAGERPGSGAAARPAVAAGPASPAAAPATTAAPPVAPAQAAAAPPRQASINGVDATSAPVSGGGWWSRLARRAGPARNIHIELRRGDVSMVVDWPVEGSAECAAWLKTLLPPSTP